MTAAAVKFGIVGCGHAARRHAEAIASLPGAVLPAACDIDPGVLESFTQLYPVRGYRDFGELLEKEKDLDVVIICTPSGLHAEMGIMAACSGKNVLVEKPLALTMADADRLIHACEKEGVRLSVVLPNRFRPAWRLLKLAVEGGKFGRLSHATATVRWNRDHAYYSRSAWRSKKDEGGGVLMNQAIHSIDVLRWIMGRVDSVFAQTATRYRPIEAEDVGLAVLRFADGALGLIEAASTVYPRSLEETIAFFGERGTAVIGGTGAGGIKTWAFNDFIDREQAIRVCSGPDEPSGQGHRAVLLDMMNALWHDRRPAVEGREGKKSLEVVLGLYHSTQTRRPVSLPLNLDERYARRGE